jgi:hypothetical protein
MAGLTLNFDVKNQIIYYDEQNQTVADSINYLRCRFTFTNDWNNNKYCVFYGSENEDKPISVPLVLEQDGGYYCIAPFEVIKPPFFKLSVYCEENDVLITSSIQKVYVKPSGYSEDAKEPEPPPPPKEYTYATIKSGTWIPELSGSEVIGNPTYAERWGTWTIIGNIYKVDLYMELSSLGGAQGFINISGPPVNPSKIIMNHNSNAILRSALTPNEYAIGIMVGWIGIQIWENHYLSRYINSKDLTDISIIRLSFEWQG